MGGILLEEKTAEYKERICGEVARSLSQIEA